MKKGVKGIVQIVHIAFAILLLYAPVVAAQGLYNLDKKLSVCEGSSLSYKFKLSEDAGDDFSYDIFPKDNFFIRLLDKNTGELEIFSKVLNKKDINKIYKEKVVIFNNGLVQEKEINISALETNEPPDVKDFGVRTLDISNNDTLHEKIIAEDVEDGTSDRGILKLEIVFSSGQRFFNIENGTINIIPTKENIGNYEVLICATDSGTNYTKENVRVCGENSVARKKTCGILYLTVTENNKKPVFSKISPNQTNLDVFGSDKIKFDIEVSDADGTKPEIYWYVDGILKEKKTSFLENIFEYSFDCETSGEHKVKAVISDGLANNSLTWNLNVKKGFCRESDELKKECEEKWGCKNWDLCQSLEQSFTVGVLPKEDYLSFKKSCVENSWKDDFCGFQIRNCFDVNECNSTKEKPAEIQACYFSINPSCNDRTKNCHDSSCEFLVDCGGPCNPCPTCYDEIQNQGEESADCGGPCTKKCIKEKVNFQINMDYIKYAVLIVIALLIISVIIRLIKVYKAQADLVRIAKRRKARDEIW